MTLFTNTLLSSKKSLILCNYTKLNKTNR